MSTNPQAFEVGQTIWLDGRDPRAFPPLTVANIYLWKEVPRLKITGQLRHGTKVKVVETQFYNQESRWYYRISGLLKTGWVPGNFLCARKPGVLGDLV